MSYVSTTYTLVAVLVFYLALVQYFIYQRGVTLQRKRNEITTRYRCSFLFFPLFAHSSSKKKMLALIFKQANHQRCYTGAHLRVWQVTIRAFDSLALNAQVHGTCGFYRVKHATLRFLRAMITNCVRSRIVCARFKDNL